MSDRQAEGYERRAGGKLFRFSAFTQDPTGGNPAGIWIGETLPKPEIMQQIAAEVGFSETAFIAPEHGSERVVRYYSPLAEVPFCGHATIASGVVLADQGGDGLYSLATTVGEVPVDVQDREGLKEAALTSVATRYVPAGEPLLGQVLETLGWRRDEIDPVLPPAVAFAGAWHLVLAAATRERLAALAYDFERLKTLMLAADLTTIQLVWRESPALFHSRNPFPVGGVIEDPATGAAAAALGGYLRDAGLIETPAEITIRQGEDMGRPSLLGVEIPAAGGITVRGTAVPI